MRQIWKPPEGGVGLTIPKVSVYSTEKKREVEVEGDETGKSDGGGLVGKTCEVHIRPGPGHGNVKGDGLQEWSYRFTKNGSGEESEIRLQTTSHFGKDR